MEKYIGCDSHQRYSVFVTMDEKGEAGVPVRVEHDKKGLRKFLQTLPAGAAVAVEASGGWYWFVDELEAAGLRVGALPEVWIPSAGLRDLRGLMRTRLAMRRQASLLKKRIHAAIRRYGLRQDAFRDLFSGKARVALPVISTRCRCIPVLPPRRHGRCRIRSRDTSNARKYASGKASANWGGSGC